VNIVPVFAFRTLFDCTVNWPLLLVGPVSESVVAPDHLPEILAHDSGMPSALVMVMVAVAYVNLLDALSSMLILAIIGRSGCVTADAVVEGEPSFPDLS
jgi:hypothetical protein